MKQRGEDSLGKGIGLAALLAEDVGLVEDLDDAVLLGKGREGDFEFPKAIHDHARHFGSGDDLPGEAHVVFRAKEIGE